MSEDKPVRPFPGISDCGAGAWGGYYTRGGVGPPGTSDDLALRALRAQCIANAALTILDGKEYGLPLVEAVQRLAEDAIQLARMGRQS